MDNLSRVGHGVPGIAHSIARTKTILFSSCRLYGTICLPEPTLSDQAVFCEITAVNVRLWHGSCLLI